MRAPWLIIAFLVCVAGGAGAEPSRIQLINPDGLFKPSTFSQMAIVQAGKTLHISGQTARNAQGEIVGGGDLRAQTVQVFENLKIALAAGGVGFESVIKLTTFVKDLQPNDRVMIAEVIAQYFPSGRRPAHTLIGIQALAVPDLLIEIEAVAVIGE